MPPKDKQPAETKPSPSEQAAIEKHRVERDAIEQASQNTLPRQPDAVEQANHPGRAPEARKGDQA